GKWEIPWHENAPGPRGRPARANRAAPRLCRRSASRSPARWRDSRRQRLVLEPLVSSLLQLQCQLLASGFDDASGREHMDVVRNDVIQQPLIMGDQNGCVIGTAQGVYPAGDDP